MFDFLYIDKSIMEKRKFSSYWLSKLQAKSPLPQIGLPLSLIENRMLIPSVRRDFPADVHKDHLIIKNEAGIRGADIVFLDYIFSCVDQVMTKINNSFVFSFSAEQAKKSNIGDIEEVLSRISKIEKIKWEIYDKRKKIMIKTGIFESIVFEQDIFYFYPSHQVSIMLLSSKRLNINRITILKEILSSSSESNIEEDIGLSAIFVAASQSIELYPEDVMDFLKINTGFLDTERFIAELKKARFNNMLIIDKVGLVLSKKENKEIKMIFNKPDWLLSPLVYPGKIFPSKEQSSSEGRKKAIKRSPSLEQRNISLVLSEESAKARMDFDFTDQEIKEILQKIKKFYENDIDSIDLRAEFKTFALKIFLKKKRDNKKKIKNASIRNFLFLQQEKSKKIEDFIDSEQKGVLVMEIQKAKEKLKNSASQECLMVDPNIGLMICKYYDENNNEVMILEWTTNQKMIDFQKKLQTRKINDDIFIKIGKKA